MPAAKPRKPKPAALRDAFRQDLAAAWNHARALHPDHTPYAFVLYGVEGGPRLTPHVLTEESLTQGAGRYVDDGSYDTLEEARKGIRYSVPDSPFVSELDEMLPSVKALMAPFEDSLDETEGYELLAGAAMDALKALDKEKLFGSGKQREKLLLLIITEDTEKEWATSSARKLNSAAAFKRFDKETRVSGPFVCSDAIAVSPDGRSLYSAGSRETDAETEDSDSEIVAYNINGLRLKRRWTFSFPSFGDSGKDLGCAPDGTMVVLRARFSGEFPRAMLMRFGPDSKRVLQETELKGEAASLALAADGSRMAVVLHNETVHVLDAAFQKLSVIELPAAGFAACFLRSGELLVATDAGLVRIDKALEMKSTPYRSPAFSLSVDAAEKQLVVSRWFPVGDDRGPRNMEFGVDILSLPDLEPVRKILVPGHQAVRGVLSPDGHRVALEARECGKNREFIGVFDAQTGRELARRKSFLTGDLAFLPDSRTLAIAYSEHTTGEPIKLWPVP
jgi:sugar lactone lactonase YvrE